MEKLNLEVVMQGMYNNTSKGSTPKVKNIQSASNRKIN